MKYVKLGNTDSDVSIVSLGCWPFAGDSFWGPQKDSDSIDTVAAAIDCGINFFDTAEGYGEDGRSESVLGKALKGRRDKAVIATKINPDFMGELGHMSPEGVRVAAEESLKRLQSDYIDLYYIHWPSDIIPLDDTLDAMARLKKEGKIRLAGICNCGPKNLAKLAQYKDPDFVAIHQLPYSLLWRAIEFEIKKETLDQNMGLVCYSPLSQGLLTGLYKDEASTPDYIKTTRYFSHTRVDAAHGEDGAEKETYEAIAELKKVADDLGMTMPEMSLAWLFAQDGVTSVLAGSRKPSEIIENAKAGDITLPDDIVSKLSSITEKVKDKLGRNPDMWVEAANTRFK
jgi:aryl-alcohol dehydrogenase-like predicted oxidoreductase